MFSKTSSAFKINFRPIVVIFLSLLFGIICARKLYAADVFYVVLTVLALGSVVIYGLLKKRYVFMLLALIFFFGGNGIYFLSYNSFLGREYENLYTQDIICHGVPAPAVWRAYIEYRETAAASRMRTAAFRHKKYGWKNYSVRCSFSNGTSYVKRHSDDLYMQSFHRDLCLRPSCYRCAFKTTARISDITLADFWGVEKVCPEIDDDRGVSLVILHSPRGRALFHRAEGALCFRKADLEEAVKYNSAMTRSVPVSADRDAFMECVLKNGFCGKAQRFLRPPLKSRIKKALKKLIR